MKSELRIAFFTSMFARPSDTFIRNEVNELRRLGVTVDSYSIRRPPVGNDADADVRQHQQTTEYLLEAGGVALVANTLTCAVRSPRRFVRALKLAWRTATPGLRGCLLQGAYLVEAAWLACRLAERRTQLLHNHIGENSATVAMLASELSGVPFSMTIHGPYIFFSPHRWALSEKLARAAFTACITHFCRSQCLIFAPEQAWPRLQVVRCSVQPLFIDEPLPRARPAIPRLLCVGRLCAEKGQSALLEAVHQLSQSGRRVELALAGDGPTREMLLRQRDAWGLQDQVQFLGWQSSAQIRELLAESTALVIASYAEGLPIVAMEALAAGRLVIATNVAAMSELIQADHNGWLVPPSSVEDLAAAIAQAIDLPVERLEQMGDAGRERVLELHHPETQTLQLKELFEAAVRQDG